MCHGQVSTRPYLLSTAKRKFYDKELSEDSLEEFMEES